MTEGIIKAFKMIYVNEKEGDVCLMTDRAIELLSQVDLKITVVIDLG